MPRLSKALTSTFNFLDGGGEMGALIRAHDWSVTPLGQPDSWPGILKTAMHVVLTSNHPMLIMWGPQLIHLYNDAFSATLGPERHPVSLGRPAREIWAEAWDVIGDDVNYVMSGKGATWHEDKLVPLTRHGKREDIWWTYGFSPLADESGVQGLLIICNDVTKEHIDRESLKQSYQILVQSLDEGFCVIDMIFDEAGLPVDYIYLEINSAFEQQTGIVDPVGKTIREIVPEIEYQWVETYGKVALTGQSIRFVEQVVALGRWFDVYAIRMGNEKSRKVGVLFKDITGQKLTEEKLLHASLHDPLTGLPNRAMLFDYANRLFSHNQRTSQCAAILFFDLDRFKPINDSHGHDVGDEVLKLVANRLSAKLRTEDIVIRLGGDEFVILLQDIKNPAQTAAEIVRHMLARVCEPYHIDELCLSLSASAGISLFPFDGHDIDTLISHADMAMYQAKQAGRNNYQFYSPKFAGRMKLHLAIEQQLKASLSDASFHLCYQPVLNVETRAIVSVEALLRWPNKEIGPDQFVPVAEATGIINPIGRWLLEEACLQHKAWIARGLPPIPIAVNVSVVEFRDKNFIKRFDDVIRKHGLDRNALQVELTETAVMDDLEHAVMVLSQLKTLGVTVLLDDFGTGYSSLAYLARLPLDKVKIDKSFISGLEADLACRAVTDAVITLGRKLNLDVVAEGIESSNMLDYVYSHGCTQVQGYYLGMPMKGDIFETWYVEHCKQGQGINHRAMRLH